MCRIKSPGLRDDTPGMFRSLSLAEVQFMIDWRKHHMTDPERRFQEVLRTVLEFYGDLESSIEEPNPLTDCEVRSFEEAEVLTYNAGLSIKLQDGNEFQVTVIQSEFAQPDR